MQTIWTARRIAVVSLIAVGLVVVLLADLAVVVTRAGHGTTSVDPQEGAAALEAALPELESFVEGARGLRFREPPRVALLPDAEFEALLREGDGADTAEQAADDAAYVGVLRALGLVKGSVDLGQVASSAVANVVGFYDTETKTLYARGVSPTPYVSYVLAHELTHALDDQHFGIDRPDLGDDEAAAFDALVEGSAVTVEQRWLESRPSAEQTEITDEDYGGGGGEQAPPNGDIFDALFEFPYAVGPTFVQALLDAGGTERLDAAFRDPPDATEQILHPQRYLDGDHPVVPPGPVADGPVVDEGELGELGLFLVLDSAAKRDAAARGSAGWGGDRYVAWSRGRQTCVRWAVAMDTPADVQELLSTLRPWQSANPRATVSGGEQVVITSCA